MLGDGVIITSALLYMGLLFGIAYYGDQRADAGRSIIANPYIYTLSLAIYCTRWRFTAPPGLFMAASAWRRSAAWISCRSIWGRP